MDAQGSVGAGSPGEQGDEGEKDEDVLEAVGTLESSEPRKLIQQVGPQEAVSCSDTKLNRRPPEATASSLT